MIQRLDFGKILMRAGIIGGACRGRSRNRLGGDALLSDAYMYAESVKPL